MLDVPFMPEISRFLGIVVAMFYREHGTPHFHAFYGDFEVTVEIETGIVSGHLPRSRLGAVIRWTALHRTELLANWERARAGESLRRIAPLE